MLIQIGDHALADDLCAHFTSSRFAAKSVGAGMIKVTQPDASTDAHARHEIVLHLRAWEVLNPDVAVMLVY